MSRIALVKKRAYSRCITACSAPPVYWSTGSQRSTIAGSTGPSLVVRATGSGYQYHDESMNVSIVSVSRRAGPPHCGQVVAGTPSSLVSGFSPLPR